MFADDDDAVRLSFPPRPDNLRLLRLVAASVAAGADADVDEIDDLRVATDELAAALLAAAPDDPQRVDIEIATIDGVVRVHGRRSVAADVPVLDPIAAALLDVTLDEYTLEGGGSVTFSLRKRVGVPDER
jgi:hypothetical protein